MNSHEKIKEIITSYHNGQKKQMYDQINTYDAWGASSFFVDFYNFIEAEHPTALPINFRHYAQICKAYHYIKS